MKHGRTGIHNKDTVSVCTIKILCQYVLGVVASVLHIHNIFFVLMMFFSISVNYCILQILIISLFLCIYTCSSTLQYKLCKYVQENIKPYEKCVHILYFYINYPNVFLKMQNIQFHIHVYTSDELVRQYLHSYILILKIFKIVYIYYFNSVMVSMLTLSVVGSHQILNWYLLFLSQVHSQGERTKTGSLGNRIMLLSKLTSVTYIDDIRSLIYDP